MSVWTHVAAVFRIDSIKHDKAKDGVLNGQQYIKWDKITGKAIYDGDWCSDDDYEQKRLKDSWDEYKRHPRRFMPAGSEGSLQRLVWVNPEPYCMARYTVTVFGDLRDYDDYEAIHKWFDEVCAKCYIRQAVCHCNVSGSTYMWEHERKM